MLPATSTAGGYEPEAPDPPAAHRARSNFQGKRHMRAIVAHGAKDLRLESCEPQSVGNDQVVVRLAHGGICGSDLHYYNHGGFGTVVLKEPMILGHEVSGVIESIGEDVQDLKVGQLVAVSPSRPCGRCDYCRRGHPNHCLHMRFYGSAMPFPHIQGAFREKLVADSHQCVDASGLTSAQAAMAEPLAVAIHAVKQAGDLVGKRIMVTGCGPIGLLCILAARRAGAAEIIATDIESLPLELASKIGADSTYHPQNDHQTLDKFSASKGYFDVLFECSGVQAALSAAIPLITPRGKVIQLGLGGDMTLPMQAITAKELQLCGSFRFHQEFNVAVEWMQKGLVTVDPLITSELPMEDFRQAFESASDKSQSVKVQIRFNPASAPA
jgi:L-idonate 5-dehydrogenase